jgi:Uma2 family endonuclease
MLQIDLKHLPTSEELLGSDDTPVDNEDQNFMPNILLFLLEYWWKNRNDWFFAVDMGVYHTTGLNPKVPVVPDGFLSLGVERLKSSGTRKSYVVWEEQNVVPILTLEVVSQTPGGEYDEKMAIYAKLGVQYYAIYNPKFWRRDGHLPLEVYKLVHGVYELQLGEPFWMPEVGLGIGRCVLPSDPLGREILSWFDSQGERYLTAEEKADSAQEQIEAERQRADEAQRKVELLLHRLRSLGISEAESLRED